MKKIILIFFFFFNLNLLFSQNDSLIITHNIITPNNDGYNDIFNIQQTNGGILKIYDRWSNQIFETYGENITWKPEIISSGVYYFILIPNDKKYPFKSGSITLIH